MSYALVNVPSALQLLPPQAFEGLIAQVGQRVVWMKSHTCPCVFGGSGPQGKLPFPGSAARGCTKCFGVGTYWDLPGLPFISWISFMHMSPTPDEPGTRMNEDYGLFQMSEPSLTLPRSNPNLAMEDPAQPTTAWQDASTDDIFVPVDMLARYTAVLQEGGAINLPYQQNLQVALTGAVTVWDPVAMAVNFVSGYAVSGATVTLPGGYAEGLNYMVEFQAAPVYVAFRSAGGLPHVRPFGGGVALEPRRFRLQSLDWWTRQKGLQPQAAGSTTVAGALVPFATMTGQPVVGGPVR
jgi:hypothetical protein